MLHKRLLIYSKTLSFLNPFIIDSVNNDRFTTYLPTFTAHLHFISISIIFKGRALYYIQKAFTTASSKLEKIGHDDENDDDKDDFTASKETVDLRDLKRVDHILANLQRKLQPAPPPPPFPDGYTPSQPAEGEQGSETQQGTEEQQPLSVDPIVDQGPAKRMKYD